MQLKNTDEINIEKNYLTMLQTTTEKLYHKPTFRVSECTDDQKVDGKVKCDMENKLINCIFFIYEESAGPLPSIKKNL
jgi:hypothetical protein